MNGMRPPTAVRHVQFSPIFGGKQIPFCAYNTIGYPTAKRLFERQRDFKPPEQRAAERAHFLFADHSELRLHDENQQFTSASPSAPLCGPSCLLASTCHF